MAGKSNNQPAARNDDLAPAPSASNFSRLPSVPVPTNQRHMPNIPASAYLGVDPLFKLRRFKINFPRRLDAVLQSIYYDPKNPAGYGSPVVLKQAAEKVLKDKSVTLDLVKKWLKLDRRSLFQQVRQKFKRRPIIVPRRFHQYQADLMDMSLYRSHQKGSTAESDQVLVIIDCFSRYAQATPIGRKTAEATLAGFREILGTKMPFPKKLQTDEGVEFYNRLCQDYFQFHDIIHFSTFQEMKAPIVERFIRTLRNKLFKYSIAENTMEYKHILPDLIHAYNSSGHRSLAGYAPKEINDRNERIVRHIQYGTHLAQKMPIPLFKKGDVVRAAIISHSLKKRKKKFHDELFFIDEVLFTKPITYKIRALSTKQLVAGSYYESQLQKLPGY